MVQEITIIGELHQDLYYESNFHNILIDKITSEMLEFLKYNPDDLNSQIINRIVKNGLVNIAKKLNGSSYLKRGGNGNNSSEIIAALGIPTRLISVIGRRSKWMIEELDEMGINTDNIYQLDQLTPVSTIIKSDITTKIHIAPNLKQKMNFDRININPNIFNNTKILYSTPFSEKFTKTFMNGSSFDLITAVTIELQSIQSIESLNELLSERCDILFINLEDAIAIVKPSGNTDQSTTIQNVDNQIKKFSRIRIYTAGKKGSYLFMDNLKIELPTLEIENIIDLTGAGDAFAAGFLSQLYNAVKDKAEFDGIIQNNDDELVKILKKCLEIATFSSLFKITKQYAPKSEEFAHFIENLKK